MTTHLHPDCTCTHPAGAPCDSTCPVHGTACALKALEAERAPHRRALMTGDEPVCESLDGTRWYWHIEKRQDGTFAAALQCYGYYVTIDGIGFYTEQDCRDWINAVVKAQVRDDVVVEEDV